LLGRENVGLISSLKISNTPHKLTFSGNDFKVVAAERRSAGNKLLMN
jgi:hypothetical protein